MKISESIKQTYAYQYAEEVLSEGDDNVRFCKWIKMAAQRFMGDLQREDLVFDLQWVDAITIFFEEVLYVPELGRPSKLPLPAAFWWQQFYGFRYKETGQRRFREFLLEVDRKNAKTFYAAGVSLFDLWILIFSR